MSQEASSTRVLWRLAQAAVELIDDTNPVGVLLDLFPEEGRLCSCPERRFGKPDVIRQGPMGFHEGLDLFLPRCEAKLVE